MQSRQRLDDRSCKQIKTLRWWKPDWSLHQFSAWLKINTFRRDITNKFVRSTVDAIFGLYGECGCPYETQLSSYLPIQVASGLFWFYSGQIEQSNWAFDPRDLQVIAFQYHQIHSRSFLSVNLGAWGSFGSAHRVPSPIRLKKWFDFITCQQRRGGGNSLIIYFF